MTIGLAVGVRNNRAQQIADAINAGASGGTLKLYTGARPATGGAIVPITNTLLATLTFSDPCESSISNGVLTFSAIAQDSSADADGTAAWARIDDSDTNFVMDLDVTTNAGNGDIKLNSVDIITGGPVSIISASLTEGNA